MKVLSPMDAVWMYVDGPQTPMHVASLCIYSLPEGAPEGWLQGLIEKLRSHREFTAPYNLKLASPRLKSVLPTWVEAEDIDLDYHFRHSALAKPGGERELGVLISRLHSHPMDLSQPLWEVHVIEGLEGNRFAIYTKIHHSLVDGVGGIRLLIKALSADPDAREVVAPWSVGTRRSGPLPARQHAASLSKLWSGVKDRTTAMPGVAKSFASMARDAVLRAPDVALPFATPRSLLNGPVSAQRRFATQHYTLPRVKAVARAAGVTVNDVFLGLSAAALRRYLGELGALPERPLTAGVPVSVRPKGDEATANAISFIFANLNTHIEDPVARLRAIGESTRLAKERLQDLPRSGIADYTSMLMTPYILQVFSGLGGHMRPVFNLTISNVPGPDRPLYLCGARLEHLYPVSVLLHGQALNITSASYAGQFNIGFTGCRKTLPHMQRLAVFTGEALEELERSLRLGAKAPLEARAVAEQR
ncbi:wax ester/triacylglycerol synthase family O-acyltransferase [Pyxidicoccus fallax]|uniref:diacylglycerol O-acyltransferase n=1 Tax=Pyxidicoccus fallax TaxID=394095 RepID=A0A848LEE9_9BACT|nr:wax ester/triacylglycerol synthase family O-acyltransferase [Pyxidicoccus fallax]NMO15195.1 wax ester/triacylglycerol synthase family O-acyltransferase [Pyxidicoccus fallax]NPC76894.1 wax ester/triacylglycerol synthase family O-acyltransferase [Pyxidicoccus fallax]